MGRRLRISSWLCLASVCVLVIGACGSDDPTATPTPPPGTTPTEGSGSLEDQLYQAALDEGGVVVIWDSSDPEDIGPIFDAFEEGQYTLRPGISSQRLGMRDLTVPDDLQLEGEPRRQSVQVGRGHGVGEDGAGVWGGWRVSVIRVFLSRSTGELPGDGSDGAGRGGAPAGPAPGGAGSLLESRQDGHVATGGVGERPRAAAHESERL